MVLIYESVDNISKGNKEKKATAPEQTDAEIGQLAQRHREDVDGTDDPTRSPAASHISIIYGGSANRGSAKGLAALKNNDGYNVAMPAWMPQLD